MTWTVIGIAVGAVYASLLVVAVSLCRVTAGASRRAFHLADVRRAPVRNRGRAALSVVGVRWGTRSVCALVGVALVCGLGGASRSEATPGGPLALGELSLMTNIHPPCLAGSTCYAFKVTNCPSVSLRARGTLATAAPTSTARGVVVFFSGGDGTALWSDGTGLGGAFLSNLRAQGFWTIQVDWMDGWSMAAPGEDSGSAHLACRPATVIRWVYDEVYVPLGLTHVPEQCGFCVTGNSGGSSQVAYALTSYGLDSILDGVFPTSGPTHAAQEKGCLLGPVHYLYGRSEAQRFDDAAGYNGSPGPCVKHDPAYAGRWLAESVDTGANDLVYPTTRVDIILGALDCGDTPAHASDFYQALVGAGTPFVSLDVIANMHHAITNTQDGLTALENAILGLSIEPTGTPCYPIG